MGQFKRRTIRRTTLISAGLTALLCGLFSAYFGASPELYWLGGLLLLPVLYKKSYAALGVVIVLGFMLGVWRGQVAYIELQQYESLYGTNNTIFGTVSDDSGYDKDRNRTQFHISNVTINNKKLPGRLQINTKGPIDVTRGDFVQATGKLRASIGTSRQGTMTAIKFTTIQKNNSWIESLRARFFAVVHRAIKEPQSSLGIGYLVGVRVDIPKELNEQLSITGLTHIVAVSGYNLTIIVQLVKRLFAKRSAYQSVVFSGLLVVSFLVITGGSAPIVRAAVVCTFSLLAWYYGRVIKPLVLLLLSGALTAFASPLYIWGDPGWYLSFLAFGGVLIVAPMIVKKLYKTKTPGTISQVLIETLCAQLCTVPYTLFLFGGVSVIAPLANVLVLPFIPFIMLFIFLAGVLGMISPFLAVLLGTLPGALLTLQVWIIQKLSAISGAYAAFTISVHAMILLFTIIVFFSILLHQSLSRVEQSERSSQVPDLL